MKIAILCHASLGGSARVATGLSARLVARGHQVHLFCRTPPFGAQQRLADVHLHTMMVEEQDDRHPAHLYTEWPVEELSTLRDLVLEEHQAHPFDILHIHYAEPFAAIAAGLKETLGSFAPAIIVTLHGSDVTVIGHDPRRGPRLREALKAADALTSVSHAHAELAHNVLALSQRPYVIPNFVNASHLDLVDARDHRRDPSDFKIVHISNFRPVKNLEAIVRIFSEIRRRIPAILWLVGDGQEMAAAQRFVDRYNLNGDVRYWGMREEVGSLLACADLMLVASRYESFCLSALESMACGTPVVAPRVGGLPEVIVHGESGYLYAQGDEKAAVAYALALLSYADRRHAMQVAAIQRARHFISDTVVPMYERLYARQLRAKVRQYA